MALCLSAAEADTTDQQQHQSAHVARTRQAAEWISSHEDDGSGYFAQISDQTGRPVDLPPEERKALMLAMVLHEKGAPAFPASLTVVNSSLASSLRHSYNPHLAFISFYLPTPRDPIITT